MSDQDPKEFVDDKLQKMSKDESFLSFFKVEHLPYESSRVAHLIAEAAIGLMGLPASPVRMVALVKLFEAKTAAIGAAFPEGIGSKP